MPCFQSPAIDQVSGSQQVRAGRQGERDRRPRTRRKPGKENEDKERGPTTQDPRKKNPKGSRVQIQKQTTYLEAILLHITIKRHNQYLNP